MNNKTKRPTFSAEFKLEAAQLVLDQNYTIEDAAKAMNVAKSGANVMNHHGHQLC